MIKDDFLVQDQSKVFIDKENFTAHAFAREPARMSANLLQDFLDAAVGAGASDISIKSDDFARFEISGVLYKASRKTWSSTEVDELMTAIYRSSNARTEINSLKALDFAYEFVLHNGERQRLRVNITGSNGYTQNGVEISMRVLPRVTPTKESVGLSDLEIAAMMPRDGIVIIAGGTGHGKSTTMAAVIREHLISETNTVKLIDIQEPIEYTFQDVMEDEKKSPSFIVQMGVRVHIASFADGVRASLRKKPAIICVGESRDAETIAASIESSLTGHLVYTTAHASSIPETVQRLLSRFSGADREAKANDLCSSLRFIMVQALLPRIDKPGRIAIREYLRITERIRERMAMMEMKDWARYLYDEVQGRIDGADNEDLRQSMADSAKKAYEQGIISKANYLAYSRKMNFEGA